jgi:N-methylhydantoinase B
VEVLEQSVPLLFTRHAVREDSAGDGQYRGGFGVEVSFELRDGEAYLTLVGDRGSVGPYGMCGGTPGRPADHEFHVGGRTFKAPHLTKIDRLYLRPGDGAALRTPGGGGYGPPELRTPDARSHDRLNGYIHDPA